MRPCYAVDLESYPNYFLIAARETSSGVLKTFELVNPEETCEAFSRDIAKWLSESVVFGYNSRNYDLPLILLALSGKSCAFLHRESNRIIKESMYGWQVMQRHNLHVPKWVTHYDIQEPGPAIKIGLKMYAARMHFGNLQNLPIEPGTTLDAEQKKQVREYCVNDIEVTIHLREKIKDRLKLRKTMGEAYGLNLMSRSDAQIAEDVIRKMLNVNRPAEADSSKTYRYKAPDWIKDILIPGPVWRFVNIAESIEYKTNSNGAVALPDVLKGCEVGIGHTTYSVGIGGLHSKEKKLVVTPAEDEQLWTCDVASYYPNIISRLKLYPSLLGEKFLPLYERIIDERIKAKADGHAHIAGGLKIVTNGAYGKFGSKYSVMYDPSLLLRTTMTGQICLLRLIEQLEWSGVKVVSANTDGLVYIQTRDQAAATRELFDTWQDVTGFSLEFEQIEGLYARDVNNYVQTKPGGSWTGKGVFADPGLMRNPAGRIIYKAVGDFLAKGTDIKKTIKSSQDIKDFLFVRTVNGGAVWKNRSLGRIVRWVYCNDWGATHIMYAKNGNKVPDTDGSAPVMNLIDCPMPLVDKQRYVDKAFEVLNNLGYYEV